ncbi:MAG: ABC transporter permease [Solirubrobacteraceae bacterium]
MSIGGLAPGATGPSAAAAALDQRLWRAYQTELQKLGAQALLRLMLVLAIVGPFAFAGLLRIQSGTPADAIFGIYVHSSGFAISLVVLSFAGNWGVPVIAGLVAGDMFSGEDRHNTWKTILTRSCSLGDLFAAKALAAATVVGGLVLIAATASIIAGLVLVGAHGLVDLSGALLSPARALWLTVASWLLCLLPALSYMGLGVLFSVASRNGIVGVVGPLVTALATQLLNLVGQGVWVHLLLVGSPFTNFFALFTAHASFGPLLISCLMSLVWAAGALIAAWLILRRRDFPTGAASRPAGWRGPLGVAIGSAVAGGGLALATNFGPVGITQARVQNAIAATFSNVTLLQQRLLGRTPPAGAKLDVQPYCSRHGTASRGPGDWLCNVYVYLPQPKSVPFQQTNVDYDVSVATNGCFKAQSPPNFIGGQTMTDVHGRSVTNPLFVVYGCFNTL